MKFEARASTGHRIFVDAAEEADARRLAEHRWLSHGIRPGPVTIKLVSLKAMLPKPWNRVD